MVSKQEITGLATAPLPVVVLLVLIFAAIAYDQRDIAALIDATFAIVLLSYGAILLIGLSIHLLMRRARRTDLGAYLALAVIAVFLISAALAVAGQLVPHSVDENRTASSVCGVVSD